MRLTVSVTESDTVTNLVNSDDDEFFADLRATERQIKEADRAERAERLKIVQELAQISEQVLAADIADEEKFRLISEVNRLSQLALLAAQRIGNIPDDVTVTPPQVRVDSAAVRRCVVCGAKMQALRSTKQTCSDRCRARLSRSR